MKTTTIARLVAVAMLAWGTATGAMAGYALAWGMNEMGETHVPTNAMSGILTVAAGWHHSLAVTEEGGVVAWGDNERGQTLVPYLARSGVEKVVAGEDFSLALTEKGKLMVWGNASITNKITEELRQATVVDIAAGQDHALALTEDGRVYAFGTNSLANAVTNIPEKAKSGVDAIAAGSTFSLALKDGEVFGWGDAESGELTIPAEAKSGVDAIAAGPYTCLALKDGGVIQWGWTENGPVVPTQARSGVVGISCGYGFSAALRSDGAVVTWGDLNANPELVILEVPEWAKSGVTEVAAGYRHVVVVCDNQPARIVGEDVPYEAYEGRAYSGMVSAVGNPAPTYHQGGKWPGWLRIDEATGVIGGTPEHVAKATNFWVVASNLWGVTSNQYRVVVTNAPLEPPVFVTAELPEGEVGVEYRFQVVASNVPTFTIDEGQYPLPQGMAFTAEGWFTGTPTEEYAAQIEIVASNEAGSATASYLLRVSNPTEAPEFVTEALADGVAGEAYEGELVATHGAHFEGGAGWPAGLSVGYDGKIEGTPEAGSGGRYEAEAHAYNVAGSTTQVFALVVLEMPGLSGCPPAGAVGAEYRHEFAVTGYPQATNTVSGGTLPPGLGLSVDGVLFGEPTQAGTWNFTVKADNGVGNAATLACKVEVSEKPVEKAPKFLSVRRGAGGALTVTWEDESGRATLERAGAGGLTGGAGWTELGTVPSPWTWTNAPDGPVYFRLRIP